MAAGQITGFRVGNQTMINDGELVAEGFEALQHCELCGGIKLIKPTGFYGGDQIGESVVEGVEGRIQRRRVSADSSAAVPELHAPILFEDVFDDKRFGNKTRET